MDWGNGGNFQPDASSLFADIQIQQPMQNVPLDGMQVQQTGYPMQGVQPQMQGCGYPMQDYMCGMQGQMFQGQQMGYPMQGQMGMYPQKMNRARVIEMLENYVINAYKTPICDVTKLTEEPDLLRHACSSYGLSKLQKYYFQEPMYGICIPFYFCKCCGSLYYPKDYIY